jgi:carbon storage regulator
MLVLTRKPDERIQIGDDIWITIAEIRQNSVRVGIEAPRDINIAREELLDQRDHPESESGD